MTSRPVIALDVDGVLMPWLKPEYGGWLMALADRAELVWATSWEHSANWQVGPHVGLPALPVIEFPHSVKLPAVDAWCASRPMAWVDDWFSPDTYAWASGRIAWGLPTLLVPVDPTAGLQPVHCDLVAAWLGRLG